MITATDLTVGYEDPLIEEASFSVEPGTAVLLTGQNGAGKTSMLRVIAGLLKPLSGRVEVNGVNVWDEGVDARSHLAFLPQDTRFHEALSPRQVLRFYAGLRGQSDPPIDARLADVGLTDAADQPCRTLSGGMRQRLGLAVVQLSDVPVWLLDEPGRSLDQEWRAYLRDRLHARVASGATVLLATHHPEAWADVARAHLHCAKGVIERARPIPNTRPSASQPIRS